MGASGNKAQEVLGWGVAGQAGQMVGDLRPGLLRGAVRGIWPTQLIALASSAWLPLLQPPSQPHHPALSALGRTWPGLDKRKPHWVLACLS